MRRRALWLLLLLPIVMPLAALALTTLSATPSSLSFADRCVRTTAVAKPVVVRNQSSPAVTSVKVAVSPTVHAETFKLSGPTARPTLEPDATMTFGVRFVPQRAGRTDASAVIEYTQVQPSSHKGPSPTPTTRRTSVSLSGSGIDRFVDAAPRALNFRSLRVGHAAPHQRITIYDDGASPLSIEGLSLTGRHPRDFTVASTASTVTDGHPITVSIGFTPHGVGARSADLIIRSNSCTDSVLKVALAGIGVEPDVSVIPAKVDFGLVQVGEHATTDVIVTDQGQAPLRVRSITIAGLDKDRFKMRALPSLPRTLSPGRRFIFTLRFDAKDPGKRYATLKVVTNDPDRKTTKVSLVAEGGEPAPSPTPTFSLSIAPTQGPPKSGPSFHFPVGKYLSEILVGAAVLAFFFILVLVRRVRGIPE